MSQATYEPSEHSTQTNFDEVYASAPEGGAFGPPDWGFRQCVEYVELFKPDGTLTALDFGCGDGRHARYLADRGRWKIVGIDSSNTGLERAEGSVGPAFDGVHFDFNPASVSDFERDQPGMPDTNDLVMSVTFLDHLDDNLRPVVEKLLRSMVSPGGFLYLGLFSNWDPASPKFVCPEFADPASVGSVTIDAVKHFYDFDDLLTDLSSEFQIIYAQQSFERAFDPPLHYHGYIHLLGYRAP